MERNPDTLWIEGKSKKVHVLREVDDGAAETFCADLTKLPPGHIMRDSETIGSYCAVCLMRCAARAMHHGYADQWHSDMLFEAATRLARGES